VQSGTVIKGFDVIEDGTARLGEGGEALVIDDFVFQAAPEGFDEGVIVAIAFATHGSDETVMGEDLPVSRAGKLRTSIGVDDKSSSWATLAERHTQGGDHETGIEDLVHGPADHPPGAEVQDRDEVQPALAGEDAGGIGDPDLIRSSDGEVLQAVGHDWSAVVTVGRSRSVFRALPCEDSLQTHETGNAVAPAGAAQRACQPWAAVGLPAAGKFVPDALAQTGVLEFAWAGLASTIPGVALI
jgi:hypothetical protein